MLDVSALSVCPTRRVPVIVGSPMGTRLPPVRHEMPNASKYKQLLTRAYRQSIRLFSEPVQTTSSIRKTPLPYSGATIRLTNPE